MKEGSKLENIKDFFEDLYKNTTYFFKDIKSGIFNLFIWLPVIWKDREWDSYYLFKIMEFKIGNMLKMHQKNMTFVGSEFVVRDMKICLNLIKKINEDFYVMEYYDYSTSEIISTKVPDSELYEVDINIIKENYDDYMKKYPLGISRAKKHFKENRSLWVSDMDEVTEKQCICMLCGRLRHEKAKKLLFKIMEEKIENWWD